MPTPATNTKTDNTDNFLSAPIEDDPFNLKGDADPEAGNDDDVAAVADKDAAPDKDEDTDAKADDKVPARLRGKSVEEIIAEFRGLEQEYSRQGNELGESRRLLRQTLEQVVDFAKPKEGGQPAAQDVTLDDFEANPIEAVSKIVAKALEPLTQQLGGTQQEAARAAFAARHPGYLETARSSEFQEWVADSAYRSKLFKSASGYDMDAAEELFTAWGEQRKASAGDDTKTVEKQARLRRSSVESGGAGKSAGGSHKKTYKSAELARLYVTDREAYNAMMPEIAKAFAEGRVR